MLCGISPGFPRLFPTSGQVSHVLLTRSPLYSWYCYHFLVRLACVRHAASVDSEPGSNSRLKPDVPRQGVAGPIIRGSKTADDHLLVRSLELDPSVSKTHRTHHPTGLSRLARSTCCQRPFRFPPERCVPVERRSPYGDRPSSKTHQPYREFRTTVNQTAAHSCAQLCMYGNCCSYASCGAQIRSKAGSNARFAH